MNGAAAQFIDAELKAASECSEPVHEIDDALSWRMLFGLARPAAAHLLTAA